MSELPTGTVTFLFTDVEGSTELLTTFGKNEYADLLAEHRRLVDAAVADGDGRVVDTQGDAFFAAFPRATGAVTAATRLQRDLAATARAREDLETAARLLGAGDTIEEEIGEKIQGYAARIYAETSALVLDRLDEPQIADAYASGRAMSQADAVAYALKTLPERASL